MKVVAKMKGKRRERERFCGRTIGGNLRRRGEKHLPSLRRIVERGRERNSGWDGGGRGSTREGERECTRERGGGNKLRCWRDGEG